MEHHPATLSETSTKCVVELSRVGGDGGFACEGTIVTEDYGVQSSDEQTIMD